MKSGSYSLPAPRLTLRRLFRYRPVGTLSWRDAVSQNCSASGLLFLAEEPLEVGTYLEIIMAPALRFADGPDTSCCYARVVRRVLNRWPDLRPAVAAVFVRDVPARQRCSAA